MIRFFRKLRQDLLSEGKTTKYLKYAIGEIVLVVIGILIALQINNWNEERKQDHNIKLALQEVKNNMIGDSLMMKNVAAVVRKDLGFQRELIGAMEANEALDSTYNQHLGRVVIMRRINSVHNGYDTLKELGFENIKDTELRNAILWYYNDVIFQLLKDIEDDEKEFNDIWLPFVRKNFKDWNFGAYGIPKSYEQLSEDGEFQIVLRINYLNRLSTMQRMEEAVKGLNRIIGLIEEYTLSEQ